jgi:hypothetical protein
MSNYTITTDFGAKDSLPSSNDSKVVRGSEFTTEFTNIQTAIATKADTAGDTFTGVVNFSADVAVNTNTLFVDVSEAKVGIGTTSPQAPLHVIGDINLGKLGNINAADVEIASLNFYNTDTSGSAPNNAAIIRAYSHSATGSGAYLTFGTSFGGEAEGADATEAMRIDASGNVGIGASPDSKLHVSSTDSVSITQTHTDGNTVSFKQSGTGGDVEWRNGNGEALILTGSQTRMRINSSGNVGIGSTSPAYPLEVSKVGNSGTGSIGLVPDSDNGHTIRYGGTGTNNNVLRFVGTGDAERMRIDSAGNVGIGTTSPDHKLQVVDSVNGILDVSVNNQFDDDDETAPNPSTRLYLNAASNNGYLHVHGAPENSADLHKVDLGSTATGSFLTFSPDSTERMRIDTSGNVLVGKTSSAFNTVGVELLPTGRVYATASSTAPMYSNRKSTDGSIMDFAKDGTTVGSIGSRGGTALFIESGGTTGTAGLDIDVAIAPRKDGALSDGQIDLGTSAYRFEDLYLSGGVHLGGTTSANKLDDYEEGTWTPTIVGSTSGTASLNVSQATYTKIGNTVRVACFITGANVTGLSGAVRLAGLPFSVFTYTPVTVTYCNLFSFDEADGIGGFTEAGQTYVNLVFGSSKSLIQHTSADATNGTVMFTAVYNTSA